MFVNNNSFIVVMLSSHLPQIFPSFIKRLRLLLPEIMILILKLNALLVLTNEKMRTKKIQKK